MESLHQCLVVVENEWWFIIIIHCSFGTFYKRVHTDKSCCFGLHDFNGSLNRIIHIIINCSATIIVTISKNKKGCQQLTQRKWSTEKKRHNP